jgi:hypothetical protein
MGTARGGLRHSLDIRIVSRAGWPHAAPTKRRNGASVERNVHDGKIELAPDLHESLAAADRSEADLVKAVDTYIARTGMPASEETLPVLRDGFNQPVITELNLAAAGITNVIWATSYKFDFSLVKLPIFDDDGYPIQTRGATRSPCRPARRSQAIGCPVA